MSEGTALLVIDMQVGLVAGAYRAGDVLGTNGRVVAPSGRRHRIQKLGIDRPA